MRIIKTVAGIQRNLDKERSKGKTIGFVPTMGALHDGHMSLVEKSNKENDITVVSVFVNPTQFNEKSDLDKYPRTLDADAKMLDAHGCNYLFAPKSKQVYPKGDTVTIDLDLSLIHI